MKSLKEIRKTLKLCERANHYVPMVKAIEFEEQAPLALDPYVFGVLLGDGCFQERWVTLSNPELFIQDYVREHLPHGLGLSPTKSSSYEFRVSGGRMTVGNNPVVTALREDGLVGKKSTEKFIPDRYKFAGVEHRIALLQGLLDTDGYARGCSLEYSSSSLRLAQDVQFLVESLGGKAHMAEKTPHYTHRGEYRQGAPSYRLCISLPPDVAPFRLPRNHCIVTHNTWTSLTLATALADGQGVALIDTEHGSASLYADLFSFDVLQLDTFHPQKFIDALVEAEQDGYAVLIIDSLSHAWNGKGGLLDLVDNIAVRKYKGNSFNAWKDAGLIQNALVEAILTANLHIIVTLRSKMDHVQEKNEQTGKNEVRKLGMAPIQRDGTEYELDIVADLDVMNTMVIQKSRYPALSGLVVPKPDGRVVKLIKQGLAGVPRPVAQPVIQVITPAQAERMVETQPEESQGRPQPQPTVKQLRARAATLFAGTSWESVLQKIFHAVVPDDNLTPEDLAKISRNFDVVEQRRSQGKTTEPTTEKRSA